MRLLRQVKLLKQRCSTLMQKNDVLVARQARKVRSLEEQMLQLDEVATSIKQVRDGLYPYGEYSRDKLFALQRSQAVLRRKIADLVMQRCQKNMEYEQCKIEQQQLMYGKRQLMKQSDKYEHLRKQGIRHRYLREVRIEENDTEERIACRK